MSQQVTSIAVDDDLAHWASVSDYFELLKPRVMALVLFTAIIGLLVAPGSIHPVLGFTALLAIAMAAGASGALNMWYEAAIDRLMKRTRNRPIPAGRMAPGAALGFGVGLAVTAITLMGLAVGYVAAAMLALTIAFYVVVYTVWLKPRTVENIVIGGAAGALPPVVAWTAVTGVPSWEAWILFLIIFVWTPPHFWALALFTSNDYDRAGLPMLPVVAGERVTRRRILIYSALLLPVGLLPGLTGMAGVFATSVAGVTGGMFLWSAFRLWRSGTDSDARRLFGFSILYLFLVFAALGAEAIFGRWVI